MLSGLGSKQAHLWYLPLEGEVPDDLHRAARGLLPKEELESAQALLSPKSRNLYIVTRCFLRCLLSQYVAVKPSQWAFGTSRNGKPAIVGPASARSIRFNLAHTDGLVCCVVARDREVGADTEAIDPAVEVDAIAEQFFTPDESVALQAASDSEKQRQFFERWTLKESYVKARGLGLTLPLNAFSFTVSHEGAIEIRFESVIADDDQKDWQFSLVRPTPSHLIAVAIKRREEEEEGSWRNGFEVIATRFDRLAYERILLRKRANSASEIHGAALTKRLQGLLAVGAGAP